MRQAFSFWPHDDAPPEQQNHGDGIPAWALVDDLVPQSPPKYGIVLGAIGVLIALMFVAVYPSSLLVRLGLLTIAVLAAVVLGVGHYNTVVRLRRKLGAAQRWNHTIFQRSGVALWREDWTAARDAVLEALEAGERDMEGYFAARPDLLREIRSKVIIKDVNDAGVTRAGVSNKSDLLGSVERILPDTDQTFVQWLVAFARGDTLYQSETHLTLADGATQDTLFSAALPRDRRGFEDILVSDFDITHFKAAQARLARAEIEILRAARVATMGALTASIAHEVNSPLAAIVASSEAALLWLRREQPDIQEAVSALQTVNQQAVRAQMVVERTRSYLNQQPAAATLQAVAPLVREAIQLIARDLRLLQASIHINVPENLPQVRVDAVSIQQVLVNLVLNAAQAMQGKAGPRDIAIHASVEKRDMIVSVSDSGPGIDPDLQQVIFEPFYSTRDGGMGMGLAICRTCVGAHGGQIWVTNRPEQGAMFRFSLPLAQRE